MKILNKPLLALLCISMSVILLTSCKKNDDNSDKTELLSFGPTGARHGDTLRFIGHHLERVNSIEFTGNNAVVDKADFIQQTSELILLLVPHTAERGFVTLKATDGDIITKTQFNINVLIVVTSMTAQARPGEDVTITGDYLNWVEKVTFAKDKAVETFVSRTVDQLVVTVPEDAETGPLILSYSGTESGDLETDDTLKVTLPVTASLSPNPVKPLTNLTVTGTDLDLTKKVIFNGVAPITTFVSQSATQLVVAVPETAKTGKLTLEAASGVQTVSSADLNIVLPVSTNLAPLSINLGTNLTITGTDLDIVKKVIFSGVATAVVTNFVSQSVNQLVVTVPAGSRDGKIKLEAASGVQTTSTSDIDVILPSIASMTPNPVYPADDLTITGARLDMVTAVTFENAPAVTSFVSQSASQIVVTVPNGVLMGKIILRVSNPTDTVQSSDILEISGGVPPPTIALPIYDDAVTSNWTGTGGWVGGGWGGAADYNNTSPIRVGTKSIKVDYTGQWGAPIQLGAGNLNVSAYTTFKISIFGAPGSGGKIVNIGINGTDAYQITVVEGTWTDYSIPISTLTSSSTITEILVKEYTNNPGALPFTVYVDALGFN